MATNLIDRVIDWFIPAELAAEREKRQLARMFLISHVCGPFLGNVVPGALYFLDPHPGYPMGVLAASITAFWIFPFLLRATGRYNLLCFVSVQNLIFCILWSCYFYGGVTSPTLPWVLTIPLLTFCYLGPSPKLRMLALGQFVLNFAAFVALVHVRPPPPPDTPLEGLQGLGIVSTMACLAYVAMMALYYRRILASGAELESEMRQHLVTAAQLRRATAEAERASAAKAEFVASMSHELRTPLNAVIGYSQMLLEDAEDEGDDAAIADLDKIHRAGQHLLRRVNEVLDLSKIEAGKMELVCETVLVEEFLKAVVESHRGRAEEKGLKLSFQAVGRLGDAEWDSSRVRQTLDHIIENAVKFTAEGAITVSAERRVQPRHEEIVVRVRDTGAGIASDMLPRLFETFTGAEDASASKYGDTGLGLALSRALCALMDGEIAGESVQGRGSCFTITLPVAPGRRRQAADAPARAELATA